MEVEKTNNSQESSEEIARVMQEQLKLAKNQVLVRRNSS
jgi:hypothetical protein